MGEMLFMATIYASCPICHGSRTALGGACSWCADPDPVLARKVLERLTIPQMGFLRAYRHTLAEQPVTLAEQKAHFVEYFVEDDDSAWDEASDEILWPATRLWFASGRMSFRYGSASYFIRYNPLGLLLRECLMCGADAMVPPPPGGPLPQPSPASGRGGEGA
jgi:hypothetical protein